MATTPPVESVTVPRDRYQQLLEKEQAADAALFAVRALRQMDASLHRVAITEASRKLAQGFRNAIKSYDELVVGFVVAHALVVADAATTDELPF